MACSTPLLIGSCPWCFLGAAGTEAIVYAEKRCDRTKPSVWHSKSHCGEDEDHQPQLGLFDKFYIASSSPSWDYIQSETYYDFDISDFVKNHSRHKATIFTLQSSTNSTNINACIQR
ncbi:hypothetical protein F5884DRAFT_755609 [Xylogone sp. PMI_703]|nr:hypothetical protein F5884DRAFT_755609 [Xylogone sp. PMI_703]